MSQTNKHICPFRPTLAITAVIRPLLFLRFWFLSSLLISVLACTVNVSSIRRNVQLTPASHTCHPENWQNLRFRHSSMTLASIMPVFARPSCTSVFSEFPKLTDHDNISCVVLFRTAIDRPFCFKH